MNRIKQLSVFIENKPGRMVKVTKTLFEANINIRALSVADTADFGILRVIVDAPDLAYNKLKEMGFAVSLTEVIAVKLEDVPGSLHRILEVMALEGINLEYTYAFCGVAKGYAINVIRVDNMDGVCESLSKHGCEVLTGEAVYSL